MFLWLYLPTWWTTSP